MTEEPREEIVLHGRRFLLTIEGPDSARRFSANVQEISTGRMLTRNPVRGRSADDVRDRALQVMHNLLGIERIQEEVTAVAAELAPGASVDLTEDANAIHADVSGPWMLDVTFAVPRDELEEGLDIGGLRSRIREHFQSHLRPT